MYGTHDTILVKTGRMRDDFPDSGVQTAKYLAQTASDFIFGFHGSDCILRILPSDRRGSNGTFGLDETEVRTE